MNERVKVISRDGVQLVELPASVTLAEGDWTVRREGATLVLEPEMRKNASTEGLLALLATLEPLDEAFPDVDDLPLEEPAFAWAASKGGA
jgi:antitoxin VapB